MLHLNEIKIKEIDNALMSCESLEQVQWVIEGQLDLAFRIQLKLNNPKAPAYLTLCDEVPKPVFIVQKSKSDMSLAYIVVTDEQVLTFRYVDCKLSFTNQTYSEVKSELNYQDRKVITFREIIDGEIQHEKIK